IPREEIEGGRVVVAARHFMWRGGFGGAVDVAGLTVPPIVETSSGRVPRGWVATGNGGAGVTEDAYVGLKRAKISTCAGIVSVWVHAGWRADHYALDQVQALAERLASFAQTRYTELTPGPFDPVG